MSSSSPFNAQSVDAVEGVHFLEAFGATEAMWRLRVSRLQAVVGMDAHGRSLYDEVARASHDKLLGLLG